MAGNFTRRSFFYSTVSCSKLINSDIKLMSMRAINGFGKINVFLPQNNPTIVVWCVCINFVLNYDNFIVFLGYTKLYQELPSQSFSEMIILYSRNSSPLWTWLQGLFDTWTLQSVRISSRGVGEASPLKRKKKKLEKKRGVGERNCLGIMTYVDSIPPKTR